MGRLVATTSDGEIIRWEGFSVGKLMGKHLAVRLAGCGLLQTGSEELTRFRSVATVVEYESAENGSCNWLLWEWK